MNTKILRTYTCLFLMLVMALALSVTLLAVDERGVEIEAGSVMLNVATAESDGGYYTVDVPIRINKNSGFVSLRFFAYNPESIELIEWIEGDVFPKPNSANQMPSIQNNGTVNGILVFYNDSMSVNNKTATGTLVTLRYKVPTSVALGDLEIRLVLKEVYEEDGDQYTNPVKINSYCTVKNGKISVVDVPPEPVYGDVNGDETVDTLDVIYLARQLGGWVGYTDVDEAAADINGDGEVTSTDLVCLSRYIAGWTGYGELPLSNNK